MKSKSDCELSKLAYSSDQNILPDTLVISSGQAFVNGNSAATDPVTNEPEVRFAGTHILIDMWQAKGFDSLEIMDRTLRDTL